MGAYTSVVNDTDTTLYIKYGANSIGLSIAQLATAVLGFIAAIPTDGADIELIVALEAMEAALDFTGDILDVTAKAIEVSAQHAGLHGPVAPAGIYKSEKLTLSLVHQANVVAVRVNGDGTLTVYSGSFIVWSGATDKSTKTYKLSEHLGDLSQRTVKVQDQKTAANLEAKVNTFRTLVKQNGLHF